jgi:hypothetical protein
LSLGNRTKANGRDGISVGTSILFLATAILLLFLLLPLYEKAKNTATLRATLADMHMWEMAIKGYISDFGSAPANPNGKINYKKPILRELMPYLKRIRIYDWWGFGYWIWTGANVDKYGIRTTGPGDFIVVSLGKKGIRDNWKFDPQLPQDGLFECRSPEDFEKDIVLWNGRFVRGPRIP